MNYNVNEDLKKKLAGLVGQRITSTTVDEVRRNIRESLVKMEADLHGFEVVKCQIMWDSFSWTEKLKWYFYNKLTRMGRRVRININEINRELYSDACAEACNDESDPLDYYDPIKIPPLFTQHPKSIMVSEVRIKPAQPLEFIGMKIQLEDIDHE